MLTPAETFARESLTGPGSSRRFARADSHGRVDSRWRDSPRIRIGWFRLRGGLLAAGLARNVGQYTRLNKFRTMALLLVYPTRLRYFPDLSSHRGYYSLAKR